MTKSAANYLMARLICAMSDTYSWVDVFDYVKSEMKVGTAPDTILKHYGFNLDKVCEAIRNGKDRLSA